MKGGGTVLLRARHHALRRQAEIWMHINQQAGKQTKPLHGLQANKEILKGMSRDVLSNSPSTMTVHTGKEMSMSGLHISFT